MLGKWFACFSVEGCLHLTRYAGWNCLISKRIATFVALIPSVVKRLWFALQSVFLAAKAQAGDNPAIVGRPELNDAGQILSSADLAIASPKTIH
jgi:hypothetical protein